MILLHVNSCLHFYTEATTRKHESWNLERKKVEAHSSDSKVLFTDFPRFRWKNWWPIKCVIHRLNDLWRPRRICTPETGNKWEWTLWARQVDNTFILTIHVGLASFRILNLLLKKKTLMKSLLEWARLGPDRWIKKDQCVQNYNTYEL